MRRIEAFEKSRFLRKLSVAECELRTVAEIGPIALCVIRYLHAHLAILRPSLERSRRQVAAAAFHRGDKTFLRVSVRDNARTILVFHKYLIARHGARGDGHR